MGILLAGLTTDGSVLSGFLLAEGLPEDWNDEEDGEWTSPTITNLEYKRPWNQKKIKNPSYPGKWKAHMIANPGFPLLLIKMPQELQDEEDPHKVKWTKVFRNLRGKDMTQDSMFEFKRKRNIPDSMVVSRLRRPSRSSRRLGMNGRRNTSLKGRSTYLADHVSCADR